MADDEVSARGEVVAWKPALPGVSEVFHARFTDYSYPEHCHDTWTVLIVDYGAIRYDLDRRVSGAVGDAIAILPPGVIHNGRAADGAPGFVKRVFYLDEDFLPTGLVGAAVDKTNIFDSRLRSELVGLHDSLVAGEDLLDGQSRLAVVGERLGAHLSGTATIQDVNPSTARSLRELLDEHVLGGFNLDDAAASLQRSKAHLIRSFSGTFGVSPHAYVIGRRVDAARPMLLQGTSLAEVATAVGFYDQAHFSRHFKRYTSMAPGAYARSSSAAKSSMVGASLSQ